MRRLRQIVLVIRVVLFVFAWLAVGACSRPVTTMADSPKGTVSFQTLTLSESDFWSGIRTGQVTTITGDLLLPRGDGRVPAVILSHGHFGVGAGELWWAHEFQSQGIAAFVVDSYTGRGIKAGPPESVLSRVGQVYDVYQALALLATHPRIDPGRIALMGRSRGGGLTLRAAMSRSLAAQLPHNVDFCAYLPVYPAIWTLEYAPVSARPIRIFTGSADEAVPISVVRTVAENLRRSGADIKLFEYAGAHHSFDNPAAHTLSIVRQDNPTWSYTVFYDPQAHSKMKRDVKEELVEIFARK